MTCVRPFWAALVMLLLLANLSPVMAQRLGRLFTTPEQRSALDEIRLQAQFAQPEPEPEPAPQSSLSTVAEPPRGPSISNLTINGVVRRRGGRTTVWVNGREVDRGDVTREGVLVESAPRRSVDVRLRLPSGTESIALRPGQKIDIETGTVLEPYENRPVPARQTAFPAARSGVSQLPSAQTSQPQPAAVASDAPAPTGGGPSPVPELSADARQKLDALRKAAGIGAVPASP